MRLSKWHIMLISASAGRQVWAPLPGSLPGEGDTGLMVHCLHEINQASASLRRV